MSTRNERSSSKYHQAATPLVADRRGDSSAAEQHFRRALAILDRLAPDRLIAAESRHASQRTELKSLSTVSLGPSHISSSGRTCALLHLSPFEDRRLGSIMECIQPTSPSPSKVATQPFKLRGQRDLQSLAQLRNLLGGNGSREIGEHLFLPWLPKHHAIEHQRIAQHFESLHVTTQTIHWNVSLDRVPTGNRVHPVRH